MELKRGYKQTAVGVIPNEWDPVQLGDYVQITSGESPSMFKFSTTGVPYFKVEQLGNAEKHLTDTVTPYHFQKGKTVSTGSVVFAKRGAAIALNRVRILAQDSFMDTNLMALTPREGLDGEFLFYRLAHTGLWRFADTTSVPQINNKHVKPLVVPLPKEPEQRAIVETLSDVDGLLGGLDRLIAKKQDLKQAAMQQLLTGRTRLPGFHGEWEVKRLGNVIHLIRGGIYGEEKPRAGLKASSVATTAHIEQDDTWNDKEMPLRYFTAEKLRDYATVEGDLIVVKSSGSAASIQSGKLGFIDSERAGKFVFSNFLMLLRPTTVLPRFLYFYLCSQSMKKLLPTLVEASTYPNIRLGDYLAVEIPVPSPDEQTAIAAVLTEMDAELIALEQRRDKTGALKQGMMQQLLSGQIRLV